MPAFLRVALPVLAAASTAFAACSISATTTIQSNGDASAIASCSTFSGNIAIATGAAGTIALNGIKKIAGTLSATNNSGVTTLSGDSLESIDQFELTDVTALDTISFPKLTTVKTLKWVSVSVLANLDFTSFLTKADGIDIENTQLQSLDGINLETVGDVIIVNNRFITEITMQVTNITGALTFEGNNAGLAVKLDQLKSANNLTFQGCASVSLPALQTLNDSLVLLKNTFETFAAPNVTKIGNSLIIDDNTKLSNLTFPQLTNVAKALQIANNTELNAISLPKLAKIGADLDFHGNFSEVSLPSLTDVTGTFNIQSTGDIQDTCDKDFKPKNNQKGGTGRIQGKYTCVGSVSNPGGEGTTPTPTGSGAQKTGAASSLNVQAGALSFAGLAAAFFL